MIEKMNPFIDSSEIMASQPIAIKFKYRHIKSDAIPNDLKGVTVPLGTKMEYFTKYYDFDAEGWDGLVSTAFGEKYSRGTFSFSHYSELELTDVATYIDI